MRSRRSIGSIVSILGLGLVALTNSHAEPYLDLKTNYYHVQGESVRELRQSMNRARPKNQLHDAVTVWKVNWTYSWRNVEGGVILEQPKVTVAVTTTLPRWVPPKDVDKNLVERWNAYLKALILHENGHANLGLQAGRELEKRLANLPKVGTADELKQRVDSTGQQAVAEAREKEKRFDEHTQHGIRQGARFP